MNWRRVLTILRSLLRTTMAAALLAVVAGRINAGPLEDAGAAYERGDYAAALRILQPLAKAGDPDAQNYLGILYHKGRGVPQDDSTAVAWFRLAAEQDHPAAQFYLGLMYEMGEGVPQTAEEACAWYRRAAAQGQAEAQSNLGLMYHEGRGVPQDDHTAAEWYRRAAEQGLAAAQLNLGLLYATSQGVPEDNLQAYVWVRLAMAQSSPTIGQRAAETLEIVAKMLSPEQIAEAERRIAAWRPTAAAPQ